MTPATAPAPPASEPAAAHSSWLDTATLVLLTTSWVYLTGWAYAWRFFSHVQLGLLALDIPKEYFFVYGLVRAFRVAGARRVLMTLWPVEDAYAKTFMLRFYANWLTPTRPDLNPNRDPVIALQQTRLEFLTDKDLALREPRVWAPYVLVETRAER